MASSASGSTISRAAAAACLLLLGLLSAGCQSHAHADSQRYRLVGKVVSVDTQQGILVVDHRAIPGFMEAMIMPYSVPAAATLAKLSPGDEITADLVVADSGAHLENIIVTKKAVAGSIPASATLHAPQPGDSVPDFALTDQDGKRIHLSAFRGHTLLLTFIYTRCPFPDYCPLVSKNFAEIYAATRKDPALRSLQSDVRLLSVSFDPRHDTPAALRHYAATFRQITGGNALDRWTFATVPAGELKKVANFFGLYYDEENGLITHSLSTSVISPDGKIYKWYGGNDWTPADLIADAGKIHDQLSQQNAAHHRTNAVKNSGGN